MTGPGSPYTDLDRPPLDVDALRRALAGSTPRWGPLVVVDATASTNADLATRAAEGAEPGTVLVAEHQTAGRGRLGRSWQTPARAALTWSVLLQPSGVPSGRWTWLPLLTGVAVSEALARVAKIGAVLKWPNDVLVGERKLAGILLERVDTPTGPAAVVGVGLNVSTRRDELPVPSATSLSVEHAATTDRTVVLREVLRVLGALYASWVDAAGDEQGLREAYRRRCSTLGRRVRAELPRGEPVVGLARDVDSTGRLVVDTGSGMVTVGAADVVHLRPGA